MGFLSHLVAPPLHGHSQRGVLVCALSPRILCSCERFRAFAAQANVFLCLLTDFMRMCTLFLRSFSTYCHRLRTCSTCFQSPTSFLRMRTVFCARVSVLHVLSTIFTPLNVFSALFYILEIFFSVTERSEPIFERRRRCRLTPVGVTAAIELLSAYYEEP